MCGRLNYFVIKNYCNRYTVSSSKCLISLFQNRNMQIVKTENNTSLPVCAVAVRGSDLK